jgi:localization factor PodJL
MARALPISQSTAPDTETPARDWQALRGELVALLDQMEGHYGRGDAAESGLAQRVRDLRYQVVESDPDDRRREALRSVKRQIDRFTDRTEFGAGANENTLQSAIAQIRARSPVAGQGRPLAAPAPAPEPAYDEMARTMSTLTHRLGELEAELGAQRGNHAQVREIADQVGQLSRVVELMAGAIGETGQLQRLETQIAELTTLMGQGRQADLAQLTERLDQVAATVDRLADLQVQQIQHVVREAEENPQKDAETARGIQAIETSIRSLYDRIDTLESGLGGPSAELERLTESLGQLASRLSTDGGRPDRLLGLVDALNGRLTEIEESGFSLDSLRGDIERLRTALLEAVEPRFSALEQRLGELGERLDSHADDSQGIVQVEAQIRQLVARMDQTGEQLAQLAQRQPAERPDFEALATLAATRTAETLSQAHQEPDFDALADLVAGRTRAAMATREPPAADLSEGSLAEIEERVSRLVDGFLRAQSANRAAATDDGMQRVEDRLAQLETALRRPAPAEPTPPIEPAAPMARRAPEEPPVALAEKPMPRRDRPVSDMMPRDPSVEAPLKEFGFPDLSPVRAALEARNGMAGNKPTSVAAPPVAPVTAGGPDPAEREAFDPASIERPPRPQSVFDAEVNSAFEAPAAPPAAPSAPVPAASRNTFIEAARRSAQRQTAARAVGDANSPIGRALSRLHSGKPETPAAGSAPALTDTPAPKAETRPKKKPARKVGLLARLARPKATKPPVTPARAEPKAMAPAKPSPADKASPADAAPQVAAEPRPAKPESFLSRHRREILLGASVVAIAFMTFNLVAQRLAPGGGEPSLAATIPMAPEPAGAAPATAAGPGPAPATTATATPKPVSFAPLQADPAPDTSAPAAPPAAPDAVPTAPDPTTTAAISPGEASAAAAGPDSAMPPPLATGAATAAAEVASIAPTPLATAAPPALKSPVKVEMPPDSVGPLALRQAAADGDARAQFEIGAIYSEGKVVPQDFKQASVWYERAAEQGFAPAEYRLGNLYETGKGVAKDFEQAHLWYERAADAGNRMAMHNLAALFAGGEFGKQDFASAANWFEKAANLGIRDSQFNLGMLYARGLGVPQNLGTSYKWFALAAQTGDSGAIKARDDIARSLDADQLKAAKAEVAAFKPGTVDLAANFAPIGTWDKKFDPGPTITSKSVVLKVQQALAHLGFDVGKPDGQAGPKTAQAIKAFEQGTGMSQVGAINPRLLAVLGSQPV